MSPKRRFLQELHGVTSQKTPFFIVTAVKSLILHPRRRHSSAKEIHLISLCPTNRDRQVPQGQTHIVTYFVESRRDTLKRNAFTDT
jgi:hypothetical protein